MRILVCGDRNWTNEDLIRKTLEQVCDPRKENSMLIHGGCRGADLIAEKIGRRAGYGIKKFPAAWHLYGNAAGPIRNEYMLKESPDLVIAFHNDIENSKGTKHMVSIAKKAGVEVRIIKEYE